MKKTTLLLLIILLFSEIPLFSQPEQKQVRLSSGEKISVSVYEISFTEYDKFCRDVRKEMPDDEGWEREGRPVVDVSWNDAVEYCNWLSSQEGLMKAYTIDSGKVVWNRESNGYRLPTEKEWMELARAEESSAEFSGGNDLDNNGWYSGNSIYSVVHPSGQKRPNSWGLYDMSGNAAEWIWDSFKEDYRLVKGGSYTSRSEFCRVENSVFREKNYKIFNIGFRIVRNSSD